MSETCPTTARQATLAGSGRVWFKLPIDLEASVAFAGFGGAALCAPPAVCGALQAKHGTTAPTCTRLLAHPDPPASDPSVVLRAGTLVTVHSEADAWCLPHGRAVLLGTEGEPTV